MARRSRGALLPAVSQPRPRRGELYRALRDAILDGRIAARERLPSSRQAARDYGVSRGLVEEVFAQLGDEGFLERTVGRGTFVSARISPRRRSPANVPRNGGAPVRPSTRGLALVDGANCREPPALRPFNAGVADTSAFPFATWQRLVARAQRTLGRDALGFADPRGLHDLRAAVARYLAQFRNLDCSADEVVIFNSAQQAVLALALLLLERGDAVWLEDPGYPGARSAFAMAGARIVPVPVDADGLRVADGKRRAPRARLAYVTPAHQYPTGAALSPARRAELLAWAAARGAYILEDDYDGEFRYDAPPRTALRVADPSGRVVYIGTLSKSMFVSLRLAFAVVPASLVEPLATVRTHLDGFTPPVAQLAMSLFMSEGHFATHLRRLRADYAAKRRALVATLAPLRPRGWRWSDEAAGLHLLIAHPDARHVRAVAAALPQLDLALASRYRMEPAGGDGLFLRFAGLDMAQIVAAGRALKAACARSSRSQS